MSDAEYIYANVGFPLPVDNNNTTYFYSNVGRDIVVTQQNGGEYSYGYVDSTIPALQDGPNWAGVGDGALRWIPGTIYNNHRFVRYRIWDGTKWQTS